MNTASSGCYALVVIVSGLTLVLAVHVHVTNFVSACVNCLSRHRALEHSASQRDLRWKMRAAAQTSLERCFVVRRTSGTIHRHAYHKVEVVILEHHANFERRPAHRLFHSLIS